MPPAPNQVQVLQPDGDPEDYMLKVDEESFKGGGWAGEEQ